MKTITNVMNSCHFTSCILVVSKFDRPVTVPTTTPPDEPCQQSSPLNGYRLVNENVMVPDVENLDYPEDCFKICCDDRYCRSVSYVYYKEQFYGPWKIR